ncbi:MAG: alpha/beta fold hydrolase [Jiangellaceae bacterium]
MASAVVNDVELFFETTGSGERLVLVHGSWGDATSWRAVVGPLADRFEVVTWDRRGHSRSNGGTGQGSLRQDADDLAALIEHLGETPAHVVGNSYGGSVTLTLVAARPDLVASAAVHEPPLFDSLDDLDAEAAAELARTDRGLAVVVDLLEAGDAEGAARQFVDGVAFGPGRWDRLPDAEQEIFVRNAPTFLDECRDPAGLSLDVTALAASAVPMLLTRGTESPAAFRAVIDGLAALAPHAEVRVLDGAGHVTHWTHPADLVSALLAFHDRLEGSGR